MLADTTVLDGVGAVTYYRYALGWPDFVSARTDSLGNTRYWAYDSKGARTTAIDERGSATYYTHNSAGLRTSIKDALGHARYFDYDADGNRHLEIDRLGRTTYFDYDVFRRRQGPRGPLPFCGLSRPFLRRCRDAQPPRCVPSS